MRAFSIITSACTLLVLSACAPTPVSETYYYQFNAPLLNQGVVFNSTDKHSVLVKNVDIVGVSDNPSLVQILDSGVTHLANYHQWASSPSKLVTQYLLATLNREESQFIFTPSGKSTKSLNSSWIVDVRIDQLAGTKSNKASLSGMFYLYQLENSEKELKGQFSFGFEQSLAQEGFSELVKSHQLNLDKLVALIEDKLNLMQSAESH
ncbi:ABC-type transport auxiliary lipoprotein family protein (plasmid) [Pseudoalteromonas xiamenensis]|uniref:PqiC family protein n=1 Tax=Pseudoalteromonas xiamenensis TaxID=882626 RepID=UPI0027E3F369|nr:ABC-type transport auxiliary lipoprotein family protein [Pseudoalteromonas xiamenensis]WMN62192.1 ABC-type transport auxiliary lipoprotein family protein [Pseudoalteromonas xiamenensis]